MWPFTPSSNDIELLANALESMAGGNFNVSVPTLKGKYERLSASVKNLKSSYTSIFLSLDKQREDLTELINALPNALLFVSGGKVSLINSAARSMLDLKSTDEGKKFCDLELPQPLLDIVCDFLRSGEERKLAKTPPNALMQTYSISLRRLEKVKPSVTRAKAQGELPELVEGEQFVISLTDITQRVKTDAMRKDFVAAASHELKTPVAGVRLMSETAQMALKDGDTTTTQDMLEHIATEAENLQALVLDLLDLSRFEESSSVDARTDLIRAAKTTLTTRKQRAEHKNLALREEFNGHGLQEIFVPLHEADIIIILDNLVDNALAYTDEGSVLLSVDKDADRKRAIIEVTDTGIGIEEKDFDRIFERFYRVDKSRSRISGGTGLGLALVKHAVEQAGGSIDVTSKKGAGSTFRVELPLM